MSSEDVKPSIYWSETRAKESEVSKLQKSLSNLELRANSSQKLDIKKASKKQLLDKVPGLHDYLAEEIANNSDKFENFNDLRAFIRYLGDQQWNALKSHCTLNGSKDISDNHRKLMGDLSEKHGKNLTFADYENLPVSDDQLLLLHVNIDGLVTNYDAIKKLTRKLVDSGGVMNYDNCPEVICVTEVHRPDINTVLLSGYTSPIITPKPIDTKKGGAAIYVKSEDFQKKFERIKANEIEFNTCYNHACLFCSREDYKEVYESAWAELKGLKGKIKDKTILIGAIYRHPSSKSSQKSLQCFTKKLKAILEKFESQSSIVHLMGDFNLNVLNENQFKETSEFFKSLKKLDFKLSISEPTHTTYSNTLIDHIYTNATDTSNAKSGVVWDGRFNYRCHHPIYMIV